ncbi:hypothetical protein OQA88_5901 [Cercophora sp. LCS_1]
MASLKCHNCRQRRLRCDRSLPSCLKCTATGQECLGYGTLLRWANAPALRGKLAVTTSGKSAGDTLVPIPSTIPPLPAPALLDPIVNQLSLTSRRYIHHFTTTVCRDLVSIDQDSRNPFRNMIPLINRFDYLQAIVIATSAMHLATLHRYQGRPAEEELVDALVAKGKAIRLLRSAIGKVTPTSRATLLAAIVFFVNMELIDSGRGGWSDHVEAAGALISSLQAGDALDSSLVPLADAIAADCITYRILGSTISVVGAGKQSVYDGFDVLPILHRAEAYSYHCCPPVILNNILSASRLYAQSINPSSTQDPSHIATVSTEMLFDQSRSFDVAPWVYGIRGLSSGDDLEARVHLASAHRAAACLYILLARPDISEHPPVRDQLDDFVLEILNHLAFIPVDHMLLKGIVWPTFMAGAQTDDRSWRKWCLDRLHAVSNINPWVCPWGYVRTAMEMMQHIWDTRDVEPESEGNTDWIRRLKDMPEHCLIV